MRKATVTCIAVLGISIAVLAIIYRVASSESEQKDPIVTTDGTTMNKKDLSRIIVETSLTFDSGTELLAHGDGGGRLGGYYEWVLFSPAEIMMPKMIIPSGPAYLALPIGDSTDLIQSRIPWYSLPKGRKVLGSSWETSYGEYRGTVLQTAKGDFCIVMQLRRKPI